MRVSCGDRSAHATDALLNGALPGSCVDSVAMPHVNKTRILRYFRKTMADFHVDLSPFDETHAEDCAHFR